MRNKKKKRAYAYVSNTFELDVQKQVEYCKLWGIANQIHIVEVFIEKEPHDYLQRHADSSIFERAGLSAWLRAVCAVKDTYALVPRYKDLLDVCAAEQWKTLHALLDANRSPFVSATDTYDQMPACEAPSDDFMRGLALGANIGVFTPRWKAPPQLERTSDTKLKKSYEKTRRALANVLAFMAYEQKLAMTTMHFECIRLHLTTPGNVAVLSETDIAVYLRHFARLRDTQKYKRTQTLSLLLRKFHAQLRAYEELCPLTEAQKERAAAYAGGKDPNGYAIADLQYRHHVRVSNLRQRGRGNGSGKGRPKKPREVLKVAEVKGEKS